MADILREISALSDIAERYDAVICDIWGVVHNGVDPWPDACAALSTFREMGKPVVLLSNSPRPSDGVQRQLTQIGVRRSAYDDTVTSGDLTRTILTSKPGQRVYHIGPDRDAGMYADTRITLSDAETAELLLVSGPRNDDVEGPDDYHDELQAIASRGLTLLCANPDLIVERGNRLIYCAGALAERYEQLGGQVIWAGKPHAPAYDAAFEALASLAGQDFSKREVLAIGDSLRTDIAGAVDYGLDALMVAAGIHLAEISDGSKLDLGRLKEMADTAKAIPAFVMPRLR